MTSPNVPGGAARRPGTAQSAREEELLMTIKAEFPHLRVRYVVGYIAIPADAAGVTSSTLDGLLGKLRGTLR